MCLRWWMLVILETLGGCAHSRLETIASPGPVPSDDDSSQPPGTAMKDGGCESDADPAHRRTVCGKPWLWGVTVDDLSAPDEIVDALRSFSVRPTTRIVFDWGQPAASYQKPLTKIHQVSNVMGELLDSQAVKRVPVDAYLDRTKAYLDALEPLVDIWEIGNEVNGDWLGAAPDVVAKVSGAYKEVKSRNGTTALTLHYNQGCGGPADHEMFAWSEANLPAAMKVGLDYVFISYYEDDCHGLQPDWPVVFERLARMFPSSALGFGECGTVHAVHKEAYLKRYYRTRVPEPRFVGGYFWWYFNADMVPRTRPLWSVLNGLMVGP